MILNHRKKMNRRVFAVSHKYVHMESRSASLDMCHQAQGRSIVEREQAFVGLEAATDNVRPRGAQKAWPQWSSRRICDPLTFAVRPVKWPAKYPVS